MADIVVMQDIVKQFPLVRAVDHASFNLRKGEIHSLIGENGAGKSTMMKMLYGMYAIDSGSLQIKDRYYENLNTLEAIRLGIGMVHQEFMLVKELTVFDNIILGFEPRKNGFMIDRAAAREKIKTYISTYKLDIQLDRKVQNISVGEAQRVEIVKALFRGAEILILDEPTAVLTPQETEQLFVILNEMKKDGRTIVFISHKLREVMAISDRITVMRQGKTVDTIDKADANVKLLAKMMVGREVFLESVRGDFQKNDEVVLDVRNIFVPSDRELAKIRDISFTLHKGEILGVAGVEGNGQTELVRAITGLSKVDDGRILLGGKEIQNMTPGKIRDLGITHIPEDRNTTGLNKPLTIGRNLTGTRVNSGEVSSFGMIQEKKIAKIADDLIRKFEIRPANQQAIAGSLSGGNAQKIVVARELAGQPTVLVASQPTRGVDVGSIESIRKYINDATLNGTAVLLVSADLDEILALSDRIIVMYEGKITGEMINHEVDEHQLGLLMTGGDKSDGQGE